MFEGENACFLAGRNLEKKGKWRLPWRKDGVVLRRFVLASSGDPCLNPTRQIGRPKRNISSGDSCLNLTREDWTRPEDTRGISVQTSKSDDLKTQCVLSVSCPDVPILTGRNL
ncbi:hypothetical protein Bbelb_267180 [Branchiostoma belcheri]|nr:hypothetical protein Bbelb_267180 [Branchiostoma belcheri]